DRPEFSEEAAPWIRSYSEKIAFESARQAEQSRSDELIPVLGEARAILQRYPPPEGPQTQLVAKIDEAERKAIEAIVKRDWSEARFAEIEQYLDAKDPMPAFEVRRTLLERYPELRSDQRV